MKQSYKDLIDWMNFDELNKEKRRLRDLNDDFKKRFGCDSVAIKVNMWMVKRRIDNIFKPTNDGEI